MSGPAPRTILFHDLAQARRALDHDPEALLLSAPDAALQGGVPYLLAIAGRAGCPPQRLILDTGDNMAAAFAAVSAGCGGLVFDPRAPGAARIADLCAAQGVRLFGAPPDCFDPGAPTDFQPAAGVINERPANNGQGAQQMAARDIVETANLMVAKNKGILAADESTGTIKKRLDSINVESTEENRRAYRELLFTADGAADYISGVILFDETLRQSTADGKRFADLLNEQGILPGIKVDKGAKDLAGCPGEKVTEGLDGLRERCQEYVELGATFAKWRAVIDIADGIPSRACIETNAHALARYAAICQETGLVPIVEPEVLMDGGHDIDRCAEVTEAVLAETYHQLHIQRVLLEGTILKPNMAISGKKCPVQAGVEEVAEKTVRMLKRTLPSAVPGAVFLSGGQSEEEATAHLSAMNAMGPLPWELSFSYGRALQASTLKAWGGESANVPAAQAAYAHRARMNGLARNGDWSPEAEKAAA